MRNDSVCPQTMLSTLCADLETLEPRQRRQRSTTTNITELLKGRGKRDAERDPGGVRGHVFELLTLIVNLNYHAPWRDRCRCSSKGTRS
jgi:hypothetical protein